MIICSLCSHSEWCDGGDRCDCACHDDLTDEFDDEDEDEEDDEEIEYEED